MCAITGSFDTDKLRELITLNSYRGSFSHSVSYYSPAERNFTSITKCMGAPDLDSINIPPSYYGIVHIQAPTTEPGKLDDPFSIHPSVIGCSYLWHNGILKPATIRYLQRLLNTQQTWDTALLHKKLVCHDSIPNDIDGSFSCLWYDDFSDSLFLFRNQITPMFYDEDMNISSTKAEGMVPTEPDAFIEMNFKQKKLEVVERFVTVNNPYWFPE